MRFGGNAGVLTQAAIKVKSVPEFKNALLLIWSALLEKSIDSAVKDYHKRLQTCELANSGCFEHFL